MSAPKFTVGQRVLHVQSGGRYVITDAPPLAQMKVSGQWAPAYAYRRFAPKVGEEGQRFYRSQADMEDGRFIGVT